ncbi:MAG: type VII secretion protein EssC, partial [Clostridia bacterium]|nr:type VII secretion protein EssC [Clostridia bacterium]
MPVLLNGIASEPVARIGSCLEYPKFNRNTRLKYKMNEESIQILYPAAKPEKPKNNIVTSILPALISVFLIIGLRGGVLTGQGKLSDIFSGNSYILFSVATMGVGVVTSIISMINGKKEYREGIAKRSSLYLKYIEKKGKEIDTLRHQEADLLNDVYISIEEELEQVKEFSGDLFDKSVDDEDFLHIRLGVGSLPAKRQIDYKKQERFETDDELVQKPEDLYNEFKNVDNVPVVVKFNELNSLGVVGASDMLYNMMKNMIIDICVRHYYNDVKLFFILSEDDAPKFYWARWFQNLNNDSLGVRNIVCDDVSKNNLFEYLYVELSRREAEKVSAPNVVVMVYDDVGIKLHPLSKYLGRAKDFGFTFVFFEEYKELLPQGCENLVVLNPDGNTGRLIPSNDVNSSVDFSYTTISDDDALFISQRVASVYCEEVGLESGLTKNITLFDLLHIFSPKDLDLETRWNSSVIYKSMAAPLGVKRKDEVVSLDLHEKFHGPHGLVAGTTGSGKSEILQSYILSMCTLFHPYEVGFVIIDFKGGGMVNQFKNLPHLIGAITNIDGDEINRSLLSIKAELLKRQNLFADAEVNHIDQYIKKYKSGEVTVALPHLIIIVDEFAELKAEQPEFMKELISAARIGRSLGVHLILATQKPAGQVNEQIWSNSKFKLCLKVQTQEDSNEVLKSPLAAEIKEPGRAYLQVGNNEIFELFQSAYSGASASSGTEEIKEYTINSVSFSGMKKPVFVQKKPKTDKSGVTQLQALVDYIEEYCNNKKIVHLPEICLPPLKEVIDIDEAEIDINEDFEMFDANIPIGVYDDPAHQYQGTIKINLAEENVMLIGSSRFGKTNFLQI